MVSIIIVNWNTKQLVKDCIASVGESSPKLSYEIIVVDNGSTDGSVEVLRKIKGIKLIENRVNLGFAKANNQGIRKAKGQFILLLNSDTKVEVGAIDTLVEEAQKYPDAGAVVPKLLNKDGSVQASVFKLPTVSSAIKRYWFGKGGESEKYVPKTSLVEGAVMAAFLITPKGLKEAGLLNEKYFMFFEDIDYCRKLKKLGLKIYYASSAEVTHYHGKSGKKLADDLNQWRRLVPSSIKYHGLLRHTFIYLIMLTGQKFGLYFLLIPLLTIPVIFNLLRPGYFPMQDDLQAFRVHQMDRCFDDFQIPCRWVPDAGYQFGYPQFNYYPPAPYYIGALLHRTGIQYIDTVKILFILGYIFSALTMFILVRELTDKWSGFVASLLYTYIPYKAVEVYVRGALSEFWAQVFFPLILWSLYKLIKTGKRQFVILFALSIGLLATTHSLMTMIFAPIAAVWALYWLIENKWGNTLKVFFGGILGFGLSAFFLLPMFFEKKFAHVESVLSGYFDYRQHFVSLYKLFLSMEWGYGSSGFVNEKLNLSLGIIQWLVGLGAVILAVVKFKKARKTSILALLVGAVTLASIFMMHMKSSFIWAQIPPLWYLQFPWRFLAVSIFLLCMLGGFFIYFSGKLKYILGVLLVALSVYLYLPFFVPKDWLYITDKEKFSRQSWEKQLTISIFDYLPIYGELPPWSKAPEFPEVLEGDVKFLEYKKGSNYQEGRVEVSKDSKIRLPLFDFPGMLVTVDGMQVSHVNNDCREERYCRGLIAFDLPKGSITIKARLTNTPIRKVGNALTLVSLGMMGILFYRQLTGTQKGI